MKVKILLYLLILFLAVYGLLNGKYMLGYRFHGPVIFNMHAFFPVSILATIIVVIIIIIKDRIIMKLSFILFFVLFKLVIIYFVFEAYVNYDTPIHYLAALYLRDNGLSPSYHYHTWPVALILGGIFNLVSSLSFPLDVALVAVLSRFLLAIVIYIIASRFFNDNEIGLLSLVVLAIFEPFILHYAPQIVGVTMYVMFIYALLLAVTGKTSADSSILVSLILFGSLLASHAMLPISTTLVIIGYPLLLITLLQFSKKTISIDIFLIHMSYLRVFRRLAVFTLLGVLVYNLFVTLFVTKSLIKTVELLLSGESVRLDVYGPEIQSPDLLWQYSVIGSINRMAILLLLGIPSIYILYKTLYRFVKGFAGLNDYVLLFIILISSLNTGLYVLTMIFQTGLTERFFQIGIIFVSILSAYFYKVLLTIGDQRDFIKPTLMLFTLTIIMFSALSIFTAASYQSIYLWAFDEREVFMAKWVANNVANTIINLDGTQRLNQLIVYYAYPSRIYKVNIFITSYIDDAVIYGTDYPSDTLVIVTPLSYVKASWKYRLTDTILKEYIAKLKYNGDNIFDVDVYLYVLIPSQFHSTEVRTSQNA